MSEQLQPKISQFKSLAISLSLRASTPKETEGMKWREVELTGNQEDGVKTQVCTHLLETNDTIAEVFCRVESGVMTVFGTLSHLVSAGAFNNSILFKGLEHKYK